jgi:acylphosphatase
MTELPRDPDRLPHQHRTSADGPEPQRVGADVTAGVTVRATAWVRGRVQGVGFRWWTRSQALELRLVGFARNLDDGRVEVLAQGDEASVRELLRRLEAAADLVDRRPGRVDGVTVRWSDPRSGLAGFVER